MSEANDLEVALLRMGYRKALPAGWVKPMGWALSCCVSRGDGGFDLLVLANDARGETEIVLSTIYVPSPSPPARHPLDVIKTFEARIMAGGEGAPRDTSYFELPFDLVRRDL